MFKIFLSILFLIFGLNIFASQSIDTRSLFQDSNKLYQENKFDEAIGDYKKIINDGFESPSLFYNLGNAYYRKGNLGYAILNYEKALKLSPNDEDIIHNLALANSKTIDRIESLPKFFIFQWWESLLAFLSLTGWTITAYIFYLIILISIGFYSFARDPKKQKYSFFGGLSFLFLFLFSIVIISVKLNRDLNIKNGIITETAVNVKTSPDSDSNDTFIIHEGLKVKVEDRINNWVKIRVQDGKVGWVTKQNLEVI